MTEEELLRSFEACTLDPELFGHLEHVRLAWFILGQHSLPQALARYEAGLRAYTQHLGQPEILHITVTVAFLLILAERRALLAPEYGWEDFRRANPEVFQAGFLERFYQGETLRSSRARQGFVWPDRFPPQA